MPVSPRHYTMSACGLTSWVVEVSLDGIRWTEIDRRISTLEFKLGWPTASFEAIRTAECRFIPVTQTGKTRCSLESMPWIYRPSSSSGHLESEPEILLIRVNFLQ
jgi:hypothetical protein